MFALNKRPARAAMPQYAGFAGLSALLRRFLPNLGRRAVVGGALEHLGSLPLTAQSSLALVRLHDETLLLGITAQSITLLTKSNVDERAGSAPIAEHDEGLARQELCRR